ncbi:MAG: ATP-binding protein [bacterium]
MQNTVFKEKEQSPFTPGIPVPPDLFVGREEELSLITRSMKEVLNGKQKNIFITGERGIGKSSLAAYSREIAEKNYNFLCAYVSLGGVTQLEEMTRRIFESFVRESHGKSFFEKIKTFLKDYIREVNAMGLITFRFEPDKRDLDGITRNFPQALSNLLKTAGNKGMLIVLDDINGLSDNPNFAHFLKSFVDGIAISRTTLPLLLMLSGIPERRYAMMKHQESVGRIFDVVEISRLHGPEIEKFYKKTFEKVGITIDRDALTSIIDYSSGLPTLLHEIGDAVLRVDSDNHIDKNDAVVGIFKATEIVGNKYLNRQIMDAIKSKKYKKILEKASEKFVFTKTDLDKGLSGEEKKVLDNFFNRMKKIGVLKSTEQRGEYEFVNWFIYAYIWMITRKVRTT